MLEQLRPLRDLVWPASCGACGVAGQAICPPCAVEIADLANPRRHHPTPCPPWFPWTMTWAGYEGPLRRLIVAHKDQERGDLAGILALLLGDVADRVIEGLARPVLVPAPSSPSSRRLRGREPMVDIARRMRLRTPAPLAPVLRLRRRVRDQAGLAHQEREANLLGSMMVADSCAELLDRADIVLLDDVVTTGATLNEATRALLDTQGGSGRVSTVSAAVICATQRTHTEEVRPALSPR